jgi:hypothetical protein
MAIRSINTPPGWAEAEPNIAASLRRICAVMAPEGDASALEELQSMTDDLLSACPAASAASLEHRMGCLCRAVEALGPAAEPSAVVDLAIDLARRFH